MKKVLVKVLVIEDDENIFKSLNIALRDEGYEVFGAENGQSGLDKARFLKPDIILLDIMLPDINGFEICRSMKSDPEYQAIPILMLTALRDTENTVKGLKAGADDYVSKPFDLAELLARMRSHLRMKELYDRVKNEEQEKSAFLDVSRSLSTTIIPHEILYTIVLKIAEVIEVKRCSIVYVNAANKKGVVTASHDSRDIKHLEIDLEKYPEIQKIMDTGKPVIINDVDNDPLLLPVREALNLIDIKSIMALPIVFRDTLIGTLILRTSRREAPFNQREIRFCSVISHLAASPLKNAYHFEGLQMEKKEEHEKRIVAEAKNHASGKLLEMICRIQSQFILDADPRFSFEGLLDNLLTLTRSEYGLIGEVFYSSNGEPYLKTHAITNIAWNEVTKRFYEENAPFGMEFRNLKSLYGTVMTTRQPVIANDPTNDPRRGGLPEGHPPLNAFLGLPFCKGMELVGMVGIANRSGGYDDKMIKYLEPFLTTCANLMVAYRNELRRKKAEEALLKKTVHLDNILRSSTDMAIAATDMDFRIIYYNPMAEIIWGYTAEEVIGRTVMEMHTKEKVDPSRFEKAIETVRKEGQYRYTVEKEKDGEIRLIKSMISGIWDKQGALAGFVSMSRDTTEQKRARDDLERAYKELKEKTGRLEQFHKITVGRELAMVKLKDEVNTLLERLGEPKKYEETDRIDH